MIAGDDTGATRTLVVLTDAGAETFTDWRSLLEKHSPPVSPAGCQFLLAYGLVPPPFTLYEGVYVLGVGDRLHLNEEARFYVDFPYLAAKSSGRSKTDPKQLEAHLASAVERAIGDREALFMQSAGKDSAALLVGIAACGRTGIQSATYRPHYKEDEAPYAADLARRFGIPHRVVDADPRREMELLLELAEGPVICADVALAAYVRVLDACGVNGGAVLDGLGGDVYMGYVQPLPEALLSMISLPRFAPDLWGRFEPKGLGAIGSYALKSALMYPAERCISGSHLSARAVCELIPFDTPFRWFFDALDRRVAAFTATDRRAYVRGRIYDGAGTMEKARLAAARANAEAVFPFCDRELIAHYFNLPAREKYDEKARRTKLPLRALLEARIGESRFFEEKGSFRYDVLSFVDANAARIAEEIRASILTSVDRWLSFLMARRKNYVHAYSLFSLFMLSAWLNRRPKEALSLFSGGTVRSAKRVKIDP